MSECVSNNQELKTFRVYATCQFTQEASMDVLARSKKEALRKVCDGDYKGDFEWEPTGDTGWFEINDAEEVVPDGEEVADPVVEDEG